MVKWLLVILAALLGWQLVGCQSMLPDKGFDVVNGMASQAREGLKAANSQWAASFEGIEPGVSVEAGVKYFATAKYAGVAGQFSASAAGQLSELDDAAKAHVREIESNTALNTAEKNQLIADVLRAALKIHSAAPSGGTQPASSPTSTGGVAPAMSVTVTSVDTQKNLGFSRTPDGKLVTITKGGNLLGQTVDVIPLATTDGNIVAMVAGN